MTRLACAAAWLALACQGGNNPSTESPPSHPTAPGSATAGFGTPTPGDAETGAAPAEDAHPSDEPERVDVGKTIADLGAIPAWQAAVDRAQYLLRRGQHGVVFGTIGPAILEPPAGGDGGTVASPYVWLVDDTEGNGALAIRVALGSKRDEAKQGDRVALGGAWALDDHHRWYWRVDALSQLPAAPPPTLKEPPGQPGHVIANGDLPPGTRPISKANDNDVVYFQVVGAAPVIDGDGWPVADELGNPVVALLNLPGEHASYGAQDMRTPDERWHLKRGATYVVRIGIVHHHGPDKPATMIARTAPVKVM
jgi:hypothetical protein